MNPHHLRNLRSTILPLEFAKMMNTNSDPKSDFRIRFMVFEDFSSFIFVFLFSLAAANQYFIQYPIYFQYIYFSIIDRKAWQALLVTSFSNFTKQNIYLGILKMILKSKVDFRTHNFVSILRRQQTFQTTWIMKKLDKKYF